MGSGAASAAARKQMEENSHDSSDYWSSGSANGTNGTGTNGTNGTVTNGAVTNGTLRDASRRLRRVKARLPDPSLPLLRKNVSDDDWNDWHWQMRNRIRSVDQLRRYLPVLDGRLRLEQVVKSYALSITPYYLSLIRDGDPRDPVFQQAVPAADELDHIPDLEEDPLEEEKDMPVPGLTHRYPDRALIVMSEICPTYCRHCTRKRFVGIEESVLPQERLARYVDYLRAHPEVKDLIISGGDPFSLSTIPLERALAALRTVPSLEVIRFGTRTPVFMPQRITPELCAMLEKFHPIWINTHFNHPNEVTPEAAAACDRLVRAGVPVNNQSVLLKGVNDQPETQLELCRALYRIRVRPYYLYQCDLTQGVEHFRTPVSRGIEIMEYLRGRLGGLAIPQYIVDAPHGGGKIPVGPNYIVSMSPTHTVLRNFEGAIVAYPEPGRRSDRQPFGGRRRGGVAGLTRGEENSLVPANSERMRRREAITAAESPRFRAEKFRRKKEEAQQACSETAPPVPVQAPVPLETLSEERR
jgi:lysine 2,3-aminomutase